MSSFFFVPTMAPVRASILYSYSWKPELIGLRLCSLCGNGSDRRGGLLNRLRESRDSGEDEQSGDCEISDGLVHGLDPFVRGDLFYTPFTNETAKGYTKSSENL